MRHRWSPALIVAAALMSQPLTAYADNCPPGSWFCSRDDAEQAAPEDVDPELDAVPPPPPADTLPPPEEPPAAATTERRAPPPIVVYRPGQQARPRAQIVIIAPSGTRVVRKHAPRVVYKRRAPVVVRKQVRVKAVTPMRPRRRWKSEWGLNLRLEGIGFGGDRDERNVAARDAGMGGFGLSLRYRPTPRFAFDAGIDIVGGTDFNGFDRIEMPLSLNGIFYFNPRRRAQFYVIGGVNWSRATVSSDEPHQLLQLNKEGTAYSADYRYFGGQAGIGLEFRISRRLAFNVDALGFIRKRTGVDERNDAPEFINAETGQSTNTSGGGLFRGGLTFWW